MQPKVLIFTLKITFLLDSATPLKTEFSTKTKFGLIFALRRMVSEILAFKVFLHFTIKIMLKRKTSLTATKDISQIAMFS